MEETGVGTMRGSIEGSLWALALGLSGLGFASLVSEPPVPLESPRAPQIAVPQIPAASPSEDNGIVLSAETPVVPAAPVAAPVTVDVPDAPVIADLDTTPPVLLASFEAAFVAPLPSVLPFLPASHPAPVMPQLSFAAPSAPDMPLSPQFDRTSTTPPAAEAAAAPVVVTEEPAQTEIIVAPVAPVEEELPTPDPTPEPVIVAEAPAAPVIETPQAEDVVPAQQSTLPQVRVNRPTDEVVDEVPDAAENPAVDPDASALERFAAPFENPQDLPMIGVVLIDDGSVADPAPLLADLGFAATIATNVLAADASNRVTALRGAGSEVAMQIALPDGAQPTDVEVTFEVAAPAMAQVGLLFADGTGVMQSNRAVTSQVMNILAANGQGYVGIKRGLGNAARAADQSGVPNVTVLRDLDGNGESPGAIGRSLDQVAFRARQSGGAVLMGRLTPQTVQALRAWAAEAETNGFAVAPVSALLLDVAE